MDRTPLLSLVLDRETIPAFDRYCRVQCGVFVVRRRNRREDEIDRFGSVRMDFGCSSNLSGAIFLFVGHCHRTMSDKLGCRFRLLAAFP